MARGIVLLAALSAVAVVVSTRGARAEVVVLTDATFEHDTQALSGMTTGAWFVKFFAPWCGHCKHMAPAWEELSELLAQDEIPVNVAEVDVTANSQLGKQFNVKGFPTLKLLHRGKLYGYRGRRDVESMAAFARGGFAEVDAEDIPAEPTMLSTLRNTVLDLWEELGRIFWLLPYFCFGIIGICLVMILYMFLEGILYSAPPPPKAKKAAIKKAD